MGNVADQHPFGDPVQSPAVHERPVQPPGASPIRSNLARMAAGGDIPTRSVHSIAAPTLADPSASMTSLSLKR
jgi:hypothetical protein